jgi:uncharacterized protein (UPF0147 family)
MSKQNEKITEIIEALKELSTDSSVPKNVKSKLTEIIGFLNKDEDLSIRINKALNLLDEISDDNNIQTYSRTQIWNIVSMLEMHQN